MEREESVEPKGEGVMRKRRISMADGRYLIFFTFEDERSASPVAGGAASVEAEARREPEVEAEAEEERRV